MSVREKAVVAVERAGRGLHVEAETIYRNTRRSHPDNVGTVVSIFQGEFVDGLLTAGLAGEMSRFDNLARASQKIWNSRHVWDHLCEKLADCAREAHAMARHDFVRTMHELMVRSKPDGIHVNVVHTVFFQKTGIKVGQLPPPAPGNRSPARVLDHVDAAYA